MASQAKTNDFFIGDLDLRVSVDLTKAAELTPADSIGLMTECTVSMTTNEVKLDAGFPQTTYASAVTGRALEIKGSLSEYSVSNLALLYGDKATMTEALTGTAASSNLTAAVIATDTDITVADASDFAPGDDIYIRAADDETDVYVAQIESIATNTITITYGLPRGFAVGDYVVKGEAIVLGSDDNIPPMTLQVVGVMPLDGEPFVYDIWKATISGTVDVSTSTDNFGALPFTITPLKPAVSEIDCGAFGADAVKKAVIKKYKQGRLMKGYSDSSC